jgi:hypothetical protein
MFVFLPRPLFKKSAADSNLSKVQTFFCGSEAIFVTFFALEVLILKN